MSIGETSSLFQVWNDRLHHSRVLLVRCEVHNDVCTRKHFLVSADIKAVLAGIKIGLALLLDGLSTKCVGYVQTAVAHVEALVKPLGTTTDDDNLLALSGFNAVVKFCDVHESASAELVQLTTQRK